jgi:hypothetical protein
MAYTSKPKSRRWNAAAHRVRQIRTQASASARKFAESRRLQVGSHSAAGAIFATDGRDGSEANYNIYAAKEDVIPRWRSGCGRATDCRGS